MRRDTFTAIAKQTWTIARITIVVASALSMVAAGALKFPKPRYVVGGQDSRSGHKEE